MSGSITLSPAVAQFKQKHPRYFTASICAAVAIPLLWMLNRNSNLYTTMPDKFAYYSGSSSTEIASLQATNSKGQDLLPAIGPRNMGAFVDRAEELWRHNKQKRAEFIQEHNGIRNMRMFTEKSEGGWGQLYTIWDLYLPAFPCPWEVERVGRLVDGGKYTCGLPRIEQVRAEKCVVYSFGVAQESSWEAELLTRTDCEIFAYDFSVDKPGPQIFELSEERQSRFHFHRFGVGPRDEEQFGYPFYTLRSLMKQNGHDWIDILKIDIEGSEFTVIPDIVSEFGKNHLPFDQLLLEIHVNETPEREYNLELFDNWWNTMEAAGLRAFVGELNYPAIHFTPYPQAIEIGYLNYGNRKHSRGRLLID